MLVKWSVTLTASFFVFTLLKYVTNIISYPLFFMTDGRKSALFIFIRILGAYVTFNAISSRVELTASTILILVAAGAAAVITLSAQSLISNILSGIIMQSRQLISRGDFVSIAGVSGSVVGHDYFSLKIRTVDESLVYLSWNTVFNSTIENQSSVPFTPVEVVTHIPGNFDIQSAFVQLYFAATHTQSKHFHKFTDELKSKFNSLSIDYPYVVIREIGGSSLVFHSYILVTDTDDRIIDKHHSDLLNENITQLANVGIEVGQVNDVNNSGSLAVTVNEKEL